MPSESERVEWWVMRKWRTDKEFKDAWQCKTEEIAIRRRDLEDETNEFAIHKAVVRTIKERVL